MLFLLVVFHERSLLDEEVSKETTALLGGQATPDEVCSYAKTFVSEAVSVETLVESGNEVFFCPKTFWDIYGWLFGSTVGGFGTVFANCV
jgi:hypothetical protein